MARTYYDYTVDPFASDTPDYIHYETSEYGGSDDDFTAPGAANFPPSAPTRYFLYTPYIIDVSALAGARPIAIKDVDTAVTLTRVSGAPGANEYRIPASTSKSRGVIELHSGQAGHSIGVDMYIIGGTLLAESFETALTLNGDLRVDGGDIGLSTDTNLIQIAANSVTINGETNIYNGNTGNQDEQFVISHVDVAHGMTVWAETNTILNMRLLDDSGDNGGIHIIGYTGKSTGLKLSGYITTEEFSPDGCVVVNGGLKDGTTVTGLASGTIFAVLNNGITVGYIDWDGKLTLLGGIAIAGGEIGTTTDTDLIQIASNSVTINGTITTTGDIRIDGGDIGLTTDTDLIQLSSGAVTINGTATITGGTKRGPAGEFLKEKVLTIGDWDMDTAPGVTVAHGLSTDYKKIKNVSAVIRDDADSVYRNIYFFDGTSLHGGIHDIDSTNISLTRLGGGTFDSINYNATSYNRGWIYILYAA